MKVAFIMRADDRFADAAQWPPPKKNLSKPGYFQKHRVLSAWLIRTSLRARLAD
jgi:hypothetical protein